MIFWLICLFMTLLVAGVVLLPMLRAPHQAETAPDVALYKAQLAEVERDLARDVLDPDEANRARTEIARRLLAADQAQDASIPAPAGITRTTVAGLAVAMLGIAIVCYLAIGAQGIPDQPLRARLAQADIMRETRPDQAALEAAAPVVAPPMEASQDYLDSIDQLRALMQTRPDELQGWELLSYHESQLGNYSSAAKAQARVLALKGDEATTEDRQFLLDLMVAAANGYVSPEAETLALMILDAETGNDAARYYIGALYAQTGRADTAFRLWRPLVESGVDGFHNRLARAQIADIAAMAGVDYTVPDLPGPSADDIANAQDMAPEDRQAMIRNMVAGLSDRLANQGGPASEWARLIRSYGVLGEADNAALIWTEASQVFAADAEAMAILRDAAASAGVLE